MFCFFILGLTECQLIVSLRLLSLKRQANLGRLL